MMWNTPDPKTLTDEEFEVFLNDILTHRLKQTVDAVVCVCWEQSTGEVFAGGTPSMEDGKAMLCVQVMQNPPPPELIPMLQRWLDSHTPNPKVE